jgi:phosphoglycerate dehydrogenase-like enzyme
LWCSKVESLAWNTIGDDRGRFKRLVARLQSTATIEQLEQGLSRNQEIPRVLVVWDRPGDFDDLLSDRFPDVRFEYAASVEEVNAVLERSRPKIVFSIKHERFAIEPHRVAVRHPEVRWIQVGGSGFEHLELSDLSGVTLTNAAGVLARFLAETLTGVMLAWNGNLYRYREQQRDAIWRPISFTPLRDKTLLVIGTGAIGACMAANAHCLGMRVLGANRSAREVPDIDVMYSLADMDAALAEADFVSVHLRLNEETAHFVGRSMFDAMKAGAFFMNTARGGVVDTEALVDSLQSGRLSGAYLDVFEEEPLPAAHPLWRMDNVVITPHAADQVDAWPRRFAAFFADNLQRWMEGRPLLNTVQAAGRIVPAI